MAADDEGHLRLASAWPDVSKISSISVAYIQAYALCAQRRQGLGRRRELVGANRRRRDKSAIHTTRMAEQMGRSMRIVIYHLIKCAAQHQAANLAREIIVAGGRAAARGGRHEMMTSTLQTHLSSRRISASLPK